MSSVSWYQNIVLYEVYVRAFQDSNSDGNGDLRGLAGKLDYLKDLGVDAVWLLPIYPSPLRDDGYDISDYTGIHPDYGNLEDLKFLLEEAHRRGLCILLDLVLNHTSDAHPWFQAARSDPRSPYRDYYVWSDTDQKYKDARIIFLDTEKSNWSWDPVAGQYYWHRFYSHQPDLNFDNPKVQEEMLKVLDFWLKMGVDGFRVDAVPYLFEREGTNCENLPETHAYLKRMRRFVDESYPGRILLCEANQWPGDVRAYFGDGDEFHMAFHFPLMPRIFMALKQGKRAPLEWVLEQTPPIPENCQWTTFLRNHDELTLEMVTPEERQWMWEQYAPDPRMRLNLGIRRRLAPLLDNDRCKLGLAYSLIFSLPGAPILYYGDEIGMGDNIWLDDRNGVRTPMQWNHTRNAGFSTARELYSPVIQDPPYDSKTVSVAGRRADNSSLWHTIQKMIALRKAHRCLGNGAFRWVDCGVEEVAAYQRSLANESIIVVNNLSSAPKQARIPDLKSDHIDLLSGKIYPSERFRLHIDMNPYEFLWLVQSNG